RTLREQRRLGALLGAARDAAETNGSGVIVLWNPPHELAPGTLVHLYRFFGRPAPDGPLPERVGRWLAGERARLQGDAPPPLARTLTARLGDRRLTLRYLPATALHPGAIVLRERRS